MTAFLPSLNPQVLIEVEMTPNRLISKPVLERNKKVTKAIGDFSGMPIPINASTASMERFLTFHLSPALPMSSVTQGCSTFLFTGNGYNLLNHWLREMYTGHQGADFTFLPTEGLLSSSPHKRGDPADEPSRRLSSTNSRTGSLTTFVLLLTL